MAVHAAKNLRVLFDRSGEIRDKYLNAHGAKLKAKGKPNFQVSDEVSKFAGLVKAKKSSTVRPAKASRSTEPTYSINGHKVSEEDRERFASLAQRVQQSSGVETLSDLSKAKFDETDIAMLLDANEDGRLTSADFLGGEGYRAVSPKLFAEVNSFLNKQGFSLAHHIEDLEVLLANKNFIKDNYELALSSLYRSTDYLHDIPAKLLENQPEGVPGLISKALLIDGSFLGRVGKNQEVIQSQLEKAFTEAYENVQKESSEGRRLFPFSLETARLLEDKGIDIPCEDAIEALQSAGLRFSTPVASYTEMMLALADDYNIHFPKRFNKVENLVKTLKNRELDLLDPRPSAVVLFPKHDHNDNYARGDVLDTLAKDERVRNADYEIGGNQEGASVLWKQSEGGIRKIDTVVSGGHGEKDKIRFGVEDVPDSYLTIQDFKQKNGMGAILPELVSRQVYNHSCKNGEGKEAGENIENEMMSQMPESVTGYAYTHATMPKELSLDSDLDFKITPEHGEVYMTQGKKK